MSVGSEDRAGHALLFAPRWVRMLRSAVLVGIALTVTFSKPLHEQFGFDLVLVSAGLALIGGVHIIEWTQRWGTRGAPAALVLGGISLVSAVLAPLLGSATAFALVIAGWALVSALLEFLATVVAPGTRQDTVIVGVGGVLLSLFVLLTMADTGAVMGFFGGYAALTGIFLGIGAFDTRRDAAVDPASPTAATGPSSATAHTS